MTTEPRTAQAEEACRALDDVTVADRRFEHVDRRGPGCWHPADGHGPCLSWQALLVYAYDRGWAAGRRQAAEAILAEAERRHAEIMDPATDPDLLDTLRHEAEGLWTAARLADVETYRAAGGTWEAEGSVSDG